MAKFKQQLKKGAKKVGRQAVRTIAKKVPIVSTLIHEAALIGLTDPFSSEAAAAKYPDQGAGRTLTFQQRFSFTLATDLNGTTAAAFNPKVNFPFLRFTSAAGTTVTWEGTWNVNGTATTNLVNTYGKSYRPTSMGVRICNTLGATDSAGYIIIAKGGVPPALPSGTTYIPSNFTSWDMHPLVHGGEWHVTSHPRSSNGYDFKDLTLTNTNSALGDDTWETIYLGLFGSKISATPLLIELYCNYEYTTVEDAVIAQLATPQPVMNVHLQTAINEVQASHPPSHKGGSNVIKSFIKREAKKAIVKHVLPNVAKAAMFA